MDEEINVQMGGWIGRWVDEWISEEIDGMDGFDIKDSQVIMSAHTC